MKVLRKEVDIHIPDLRVMSRITDGGVEFFGERINLRSPAIGDFYVDKDNWVITQDPLGGIELHSADAAASFQRENSAGNNVHEQQFVKNEKDSNV